MHPNTHTKRFQYPLPEVSQIIDEQADYKCWSVMDLKAGFNNIPVKPECYHQVGFVTHDGVFRFKRMIWGLANAPMWF